MREQGDERVPSRRVVDAAPAVELVEPAEGAGVLAVEDCVDAVLVERRVPLLDRVRGACDGNERPGGQQEAHEDRAPGGGADRRLGAADGDAHADGLAQGQALEGESPVGSTKVAQAPRPCPSQGAEPEDGKDARTLPFDTEGGVCHGENGHQPEGERGRCADSHQGRTHARPQPHEAREHQGHHHGEEGREQHPPGEHALTPCRRGRDACR